MHFHSDNTAAVHPKVWEAMLAADTADHGYDGDRWSARLDAVFSDLFGQAVRVLWVPTGTAANSLALAAICPPWKAVACHREAHIEVDEAGAPAFYSGGSKLLLLDGPGAKITPHGLETLLTGIRPDVHQVQVAAVSITNATEYGTVWRPAEVSAIAALARAHGLKLHMDGARFANAIVHAGCAPGDVTGRAGVDVLSFGCVKNGGMSAEAIVCFDSSLADEIAVRRKRAGHLQSKGRYLAAQLLAMVETGLWRENAKAANDAAQTLAQACGDRLMHAVEANELFVRMSAAETARLRAQGFDFYDWGVFEEGQGAIRLVTAWNSDAEHVKMLADAIAAL